MPNETHTNTPAERPVGDDTTTVLTAALIGAAIGAGLGLLASRAFDDDDVTAMFHAARKRARRGIRRGSAAAGAAAGAIGERAGGAIGDARDAVGEFASHARDSFETMLEREVRQLRKAARRQRRRLGL